MKYLLLFFSLLFSTLSALSPRAFNSAEEAQCYLTTHYELGCKYYDEKDWRRAYNEFEKVIYFFPDSEEAAEVYFYLGVSLYEIKQYDFANTAFSDYLRASYHPPYFEEAVSYKFAIAEIFKGGRKRHAFNYRYFPRTSSGLELALEIYDEIAIALPNQQIAIDAIFAKADLLVRMKRFRNGIETYQAIIRRFPDSEIVPECYLRIAHAYYLQSKIDCQNPDIYGLAELNSRKFEEEYPKEEKVCLAKTILEATQENFAAGFSRLAGFYERTGHAEAAKIYYRSGIEKYPDSVVASYCRFQLDRLGCEEEIIIPEKSCMPLLQDIEGEEIAEASSESEEPAIPVEETAPVTEPAIDSSFEANKEAQNSPYLLADATLEVQPGEYETRFSQTAVYSPILQEPSYSPKEEVIAYKDVYPLDRETYESTFYEEPVYDEVLFPKEPYEMPACRQSVYEEATGDGESGVYLHYSLLKNK